MTHSWSVTVADEPKVPIIPPAIGQLQISAASPELQELQHSRIHSLRSLGVLISIWKLYRDRHVW